MNNEKDEVNENVIRHDGTRYCEVGKRSTARRGNLLSECENCFKNTIIPHNISPKPTPQSLFINKSLFASKRAAFTLAEVLITLTVIGIVAAMTIPNLVQSYQEKETVVKLKKVYSILSNAYLMARAEDENVRNWLPEDGTTAVRSEAFYNHLKPYLKISKDCGFEKGCLADGYVKTVGGVKYNNYNSCQSEYRIILSDGTSLMFYVPSNTTVFSIADLIGNIKVDINGFKGPYTFGKDFFVFDITESKILPNGVRQREAGAYSCDRKNTDRDTAGSGCTAWVIYNENMDYLHCDDLSWDGKHKCSD